MYCERRTQRSLQAIAFQITTHTHTHTRVYMFSEIFTGNLEEFSVSAHLSCRKHVPNGSFLLNYQIVHFVISDDSNEYSYNYLTS